MAEPAKTSYHLVYQPDGAPLATKSFASLEGLCAFLRKLPTGTLGMSFYGEPVFVTRGPWRYLVHGDKQLPLFDPPAVGPVDRTTALGELEDKNGPDQGLEALLAQEKAVLVSDEESGPVSLPAAGSDDDEDEDDEAFG